MRKRGKERRVDEKGMEGGGRMNGEGTYPKGTRTAKDLSVRIIRKLP